MRDERAFAFDALQVAFGGKLVVGAEDGVARNAKLVRQSAGRGQFRALLQLSCKDGDPQMLVKLLVQWNGGVMLELLKDGHA